MRRPLTSGASRAPASGGFELIRAEATSISAEARLSLGDTGLWHAEHESAWQRIVEFVHDRGTKIGIRLSHAGRKASIHVPWGPDVGHLRQDEDMLAAGFTETVFVGQTALHDTNFGLRAAYELGHPTPDTLLDAAMPGLRDAQIATVISAPVPMLWWGGATQRLPRNP